MKWKTRAGSDEDISLMGLLPFVFLIGTSTALGEKETRRMTIKKCCPKGQQLNSTLMCVNASGDLAKNEVKNVGGGKEAAPHAADDPSEVFPRDFNDSSAENNSSFPDIFSWFPFPSLISSETFQRVTELSSVTDLVREAEVQYGALPECSADEMDSSCFTAGRSQQFYLLLYPQQDIQLYISKKSSYHDRNHFRVDDRNCDFSGTNSDDDSEVWTSDRKWRIQDLRTFPLEDFCMDKGPGGSFMVEYCPCKTVPCLRKCCKDSEFFDEKNQKCTPNSTFGFWRPSLKNSNLSTDYYLLSNRHPARCGNPRWLKIPRNVNLNFEKTCGNQQTQEERNKFYFLSDGSLQVKRYKTPISSRSFCGDHMMYDSDDFVDDNLLLCEATNGSLFKLRIYGAMFIFGGIFLLLTIAISLYLPELRSSVYNKVIICHNVSLMLAYFLWGSTYLLPYVRHNLCIFLSLGIQCTFLASFFWMNVMCLDISSGIRRFKSSGETSDNQKFLRYLIYACGAPIIITSITAAMEFAPSLPPQYVRPGFGCSNCGFNLETISILIYIYGPMMAIILLNLIFFVRTVFQIIKIQKETAILGNQASTSNAINTGKLRLFGKLFLLMGLSWIMEIVSWAVGGQEYYWYIPDFVNILRAVFIFIIIICKKAVLRSLMMKLKGCPNVPEENFRSRKNTGTTNKPGEMRKERNFGKQITDSSSGLDESGV